MGSTIEATNLEPTKVSLSSLTEYNRSRVLLKLFIKLTAKDQVKVIEQISLFVKENTYE